MQNIYEVLFSQYAGYTTLQIWLEFIAVVLGIASVVYSKNNSILLYPTGLASTIIYIYLLLDWELYGDLLINLYYFYMSVYGWILWGKRYENSNDSLKITIISYKDSIACALIFLFSIIFVSGIYIWLNRFDKWWAYADIFMTGLLFVGTWLLAKRKLENWLFLIAGDIIAIPLFYLKGYTLTSILNLFLTIIAIYGYVAWKRTLHVKKSIL
ncbi:nicotinamide mononucleotide transporter [Flavobacterium rivuli WB 3.3-2 = DSM 21788]|uniref:Nicotinamide riboside transporter PnuC n=1 Tax=Flavobacterium rivuli WB 3.3-2 = DSM 21788 TaxID=1121895 RepID=A0A0A2M352_9FLAO|nr:nicotinamide riboside transporter PnuC [Flavobacterium rivuli]KGO86046.1 nicotinamide mononucleotide transporter [Flavobacterium rivuli WB 3.3-2 = DSM 21788]